MKQVYIRTIKILSTSKRLLSSIADRLDGPRSENLSVSMYIDERLLVTEKQIPYLGVQSSSLEKRVQQQQEIQCCSKRNKGYRSMQCRSTMKNSKYLTSERWTWNHYYHHQRKVSLKQTKLDNNCKENCQQIVSKSNAVDSNFSIKDVILWWKNRIYVPEKFCT